MPTDVQPKILLIDDEKMLLEMYSLKFNKGGFGVFACGSGEAAISALKGGYNPDVILFDITMPGMSGYEFLEKIREIPLPASCLKIALTNEGQDNEIGRMKELGAEGHLLKALYTPAELVVEVQNLLKKNRPTDLLAKIKGVLG